MRALAIDSDGILYAGGEFSWAGQVEVKGLARWDGSAWGAVGGFDGFNAHALAVGPGGELYASSATLAGASVPGGVVRWDGVAWTPLNEGIPEDPFPWTVHALVVDEAGRVHAGGRFFLGGGASAGRAARWDGTAWTTLGEGADRAILALALAADGGVYAGGEFTAAGEAAANRIAAWDGERWRGFGASFNGAVHAFAIGPTGEVYVGGAFTTAGGVRAHRVARWDGGGWAALGGTFDRPVRVLTLSHDGELYAGGEMTRVDTLAVPGLARWDGARWHDVGGEVPSFADVRALVFDPSGALYVGGRFGWAARWDGAEWAALGGGLSNVHTLVLDASGRLVAAGSFRTLGAPPLHGLAVWDGTAWRPLGEGVGPSGSAIALTTDEAGELYVAGIFETSTLRGRHLARWDGTAWSPVATGLHAGTRTLLARSPTEIYAAGSVPHPDLGLPHLLWRWDGTAWTGVDPEVDPQTAHSLPPAVHALARDPEGRLYLGGEFTLVGSMNSPYLARWTPPPGVAAEPGPAAPPGLELRAVYPTPSAGRTTVTLSVGEPREVRVGVYDLLGRRVAVLADGPLGVGTHTLTLDVSGLASGVYVVRAESGPYVHARRLHVVR